MNPVSPAQQQTALWAGTVAFTVSFAVWTIFSIIGVQIKAELGLNDTQFGLLVATPILTGSLSRIFLGVWTEQFGGRLIFSAVMLAGAIATWLLTWASTYPMYLLAALGIYGVLSYSVSQRTREIGLRMALGASGGSTIAMIVRSSVAMVALGGVIGLIAATLLARSMEGILFGVEPFDVPSFTLAAVTLLIAGVVASLLPALRTTRVDPVVALRNE